MDFHNVVDAHFYVLKAARRWISLSQFHFYCEWQISTLDSRSVNKRTRRLYCIVGPPGVYLRWYRTPMDNAHIKKNMIQIEILRETKEFGEL